MKTSWLTPLTGHRLTRRFVDSAFVRYAHARTQALDRLDTARVQEQTLLELLRTARDTTIGREFQFSSIRTVEEYQARVPVRDYEEFWQTYWKSAYPRLTGITWPDAIPYYALSSGTTTGATKYLPISHQMVKSNRKAANTTLALFRHAYPEVQTFTGKFFFLGGCTDMRPQEDGSFAGDLSGIAAKELADFARPYIYPPLELSLISDWNIKLAKLAEQSRYEPISAVSGVPSWMLKLFDTVMEKAGKSTLAEVWPQLRLIIHGGTKFDSFRATFKNAIGSDQVRYCEVYPCSEGFIATEDPRYQLLRVVPDHGIFFEFIPVEQFQDGKLTNAQPTRQSLRTVEPGVVYAVVLTTCAGLWSYLIGDTVRFVRRDPPLLEFTGRLKNFLSAFGEHLIEEEVEKAIAAASAACGVLAKDHHVGPVFPTDPKKPGHHRFFIEFHGPHPADVTRFLTILDTELSRLNEDYAAHRVGDLTLLSPQLTIVPEGGFARWMASRGKAGGQNKVPRMDNNGKITQQLAEFFTTS